MVGHLDAIKLLIGLGADIEYQDLVSRCVRLLFR